MNEESVAAPRAGDERGHAPGLGRLTDRHRRRFLVMAVVTAMCAGAQIALGGIVRVSGSGLGCQDQWPACRGQLLPGWDVHAMVEYAHRSLGALTGLLMVATFVAAVIFFRHSRPALVWMSGLAVIVVALEIPLGALVVFRDLAGVLVMAHLVVAMALLGLLCATAVLVSDPMAPSNPRVRASLAWLAGFTFVGLLTGGGVVASQADAQCHAWPLCANGFQLDFTGVNAFTMLHRLTLGLVGLVALYALWCAWRARRSDRGALAWTAIAVVLVIGQGVIGAFTAVLGDSALFDGLHVAMASVVWGVAITAALLVRRPWAPGAPVQPGIPRPPPRPRPGAA